MRLNAAEAQSWRQGQWQIRHRRREQCKLCVGNAQGHGERIEANAGYHIWDLRNKDGEMGAAACVVIIPWFADW